MVVRPEVDRLPAYKPGVKPEEELRRLGIAEPVQLNLNEGPWPPFPEAIEAMQRELANLNRYPDQAYPRLTAALAETYGVDPAQIIVGNGSGNIIRLFAQIVLNPDDEVLMAWPPYPNYAVTAALSGAEVVRIGLQDGAMDLRAALAAVSDRTRLVIIANPHNPTASIVPRGELERYFERVPAHVATLLDEAYFEFISEPGYPDTRAFLGAGKPLLGLRTFSKAYGLAGLRIGFGFATADIADALNRARETFIVSSLAAEAARVSLARQDLVRERVRMIVREREWLCRQCDGWGLTYTPCQANFLFVDTRRPAREVVHGMMRRGILIRAGELDGRATWVRITIGLPDENRKAAEALGAVLAEVPEAAPVGATSTPTCP
jgi:histidinol-phosphate aminotransferase